MQQFQSNYYTASQMLYIVADTQPCLTITVASTWNYTVSTKNWTLSISSLKKLVRDITRISCFVITMKLPHALQIYSSVFVKSFSSGKNLGNFGGPQYHGRVKQQTWSSS